MNNIKKSLTELVNACQDQQFLLNEAILELGYLEKQVEELVHTIKHAYQLSDGSWISLEELAQRYNNAVLATQVLGDVYARD